MNFRTELKLNPSDWKISHNSSILCLGSCFADEIGNRLASHKFPTLVNPFGIVYHPYPLIELLNGFCKSEDEFLNELYPTFFNKDDRWGSFALPGTHASRESLVFHLQGIHQYLSEYLKTLDFLILTFGTSIGFYHEKLDRTVANCHKFPERDFNRFLDNSDRMSESISETLTTLQELNPRLKVIVTVSPVRHIRSGIVNNSASKAHLRILCSELEATIDKVEYFPSYEIVMDDLRDYRFFKADMIHPNEVAVDYIWNKMVGVYFSEETQRLNHRIEQVNRDLAHRPMQPQSQAHQKFLDQLEEKISQLATTVDMAPEKEALDGLRKFAEE